MDMTTFDLGRGFDVVACLFSAIAYVRSSQNLARTVANLAKHANPGGVVFLEPYFTPERYRVDEVTLNVKNQSLPKIAWMYISRRRGNVAIQDVHYLVGTPEGIEHFEERHELGLFTEDEYVSAFKNAGLAVTYDAAGLFGRGMYIGSRRQHERGLPQSV
jgi:hypothetical protein